MDFTETHIKILLALSNMVGTSNTELVTQLGMKKTNLSTSLRELEDQGVISRGVPRKSKEGKNYAQIPFYINLDNSEDSASNRRTFESLIQKMVDKNKISEFSMILKSKYMDEFINRYGFMPLFDMIDKFKGFKDFYKILSQFILNQPDFIKK
jgi:DNA-binding Lrp family transcriptional regulator